MNEADEFRLGQTGQSALKSLAKGPGATGKPRLRHMAFRSRREAARELGLSRRHTVALGLLADGADDQQILDQLGVSLHTEHKLLRQVFAKFGIHRRYAVGLLWRELAGPA